MDFYQNSTHVNGYDITYGGGISFFNDYAGKSNVIFYKTGTMQKVVSDSLNLTANAAYTLFLANLIATPDFLLLKDTISTPPTDMAYVRFVDLSPDALAVDLLIKGGSGIGFNKTYKGYSAFVATQVATADTLEVVKTETATVLASVAGVTLQSGGVYTIGLYGLANTTISGDKLILGVTEDVFY